MQSNGNEPFQWLPIPPDHIESYARIQEIQSTAARESGERKLRHWYAIAILTLLVLQLLFIAAVVFLLGFGIIALDRWVATTIISGTLAEVSGMGYLVVRYLFPPIPNAAD